MTQSYLPKTEGDLNLKEWVLSLVLGLKKEWEQIVPGFITREAATI